MQKYLTKTIYFASLAAIIISFLYHLNSLENKFLSSLLVLVIAIGILFEIFSTKVKSAQKLAETGYISSLAINAYFNFVINCNFNRYYQTSIRWLFFVGFLMCISGLIFRLLAKNKLKNIFTYSIKIQPEHQLITTGIYAYTRHPSYFGSYLFAIGILLMSDCLIAFVFVICYIPFGIIRIKKEENNLKSKFGVDYLNYIKKTPFLVPTFINVMIKK